MQRKQLFLPATWWTKLWKKRSKLSLQAKLTDSIGLEQNSENVRIDVVEVGIADEQSSESSKMYSDNKE